MWGSAGEAVGAPWSQVCRKGQLVGQTNAEAFKAQPALERKAAPSVGRVISSVHLAFPGLEDDTFAQPAPPRRVVS